MFTYSTKGTCSRQILFDVDADNKLHNVRFIGGCGGNLQGIARLVEGKNIDDIQDLLAGIKVVHLSDYIASRNFFNKAVDFANEFI